ncbi:hypothetical protein [Streptomyces tendae]|uniref:hypothetical protein n=1 Tax=Streptomyces tendae TaxID=1932 RepID=UPI003D75EE7E
MSYPTLFTTPGVRAFAEEIDAERQRQLAKFGDQHHPDGTGRGGYIEQAETARTTCQMDAAITDGGPRWSLILLEEVYEALAESDPARLRTELLQVAAVSAAWIADLDSRQAAAEQPFVPPAHYRRDDGVDCCVHAVPVGPNSCRACRELADAEAAAGARR